MVPEKEIKNCQIWMTNFDSWVLLRGSKEKTRSTITCSFEAWKDYLGKLNRGKMVRHFAPGRIFRRRKRQKGTPVTLRFQAA